MKDLLLTKFISHNGNVEASDSFVKLHGEGTIFGQKFHIPQKVYTFVSEQVFDMQEYFVLEYKCLGIRRQLSIRKPFIYAIDGDNRHPLVCYDDISTDNKKHSIIVKAPRGTYTAIEIEFSIDRRTKADFVVYKMYTCTQNELPICCASLATNTSYDFRTIDIAHMYNREMSADTDVLIDGGRFFEDESISLHNIPFKVRLNGNNMIAPPPPPAENDDEILNFGVKAKRRKCRPISRDSLTEICIGESITELYFIMHLTGMRHQRWGFATDGTILGSAGGDVTSPLFVDDVEGFMVELVYKDGTRDTALPYNIDICRHGVQGDMRVYAVPANGSAVEKVVFHNRKLDTDMSIVAVTVNNTQNRLFPNMLIPDLSETITHNVSTDKKMELSGDIFTIKNGGISMVLDTRDGLKLVAMVNEYVPDFKVKPGYILRLRDEDNTVTHTLSRICAEVRGNKAQFAYAYKDFEIKVFFENVDNDSIKSGVEVANIGGEPQRTGVIFPEIYGITHIDNDDGWYFFPKLQNINSNETAFIYEESAPSFPMQFMDVYSPTQQGGLCLTTQERETVVRKYALEKDENGISFYVEYPAMYGELQPGEKFTGSPTMLTAHPGDWRKSFDIYKKWLDSWYQPYKCQDKQWYRECFWLLAEIRDFFESEEFTKSPIWYDTEKKEFNFRKILEEQKELSGYYPDILHLWGWTKFKEEGCMQWGNFGTTDYDYYGGRESFKNALHDIKDNMGLQVSLYLHPTLLTDCYPQAEKFFPKHRVINDTDDFIMCGEHAYRMCHANEDWRNHAISMYPRIYKDLDIPLLYVDEFSLRVENRCYAEGHGHCVPSNLLKTDRDFITQLKDAMPEHVVLYGEYEAVDINARYIDCNISYYIIDAVMDMVETAWRAWDGDDTFSRVYTNMYRFAFPKIVQLVLPMAMRNLSWHPQKFMFFNGEAIYDSFWDLEESAGHDFTCKAYGLKKKYADCFSSDNPSTMIDTLSPAICANCFPGKGRTVYTLYNRAYTTYRGAIIKVKHIDGATYYDAWNDCELDYKLVDGYAELSMVIDAQQMGCIEIKY